MFRLKTLLKRITWLLLPLLLAIFVSILTNREKTNASVSLESIPPKDLKVLNQAFHFIETNYVDPQAIDPFRMFQSASKELERSVPPLIVKEANKTFEVNLDDKKIFLPISNPMAIRNLASPLSRLLGFLSTFYTGRPEEKDRLYLTMNGVMDTLDPHSNYLPPKVYNEFKIGTKGNFGGLGIVIGIRDGDLTVIAPLEGTPAYQAGIKSKDKIVQIGEESTINMGLTEAVERLRGPIGSSVSVVINRAGIAASLKFSLTRALIKIQSVGGRLLPENKKIALVKVKNFQEDTLDQFKKTLKSFRREGGKLEGLILDLRNNPGGLLDQAIKVADYLLAAGTIVKTVGAHGETLDTEEARPGQEGEDLPFVVLVNEGSASASEILAGASQLNHRALVLGARTFGKGSVQTVYDLKDGSAIKLTIAKYLTAKDQPVQSIGINPDVGLIPATIDPKLVDIFEDVKQRELDLEERDREEERKPADFPPPPLQMTYLSPEKKEDEETTGQIDLKDDFPVQLAQQVLELPESRSLDRQKVLKALPPLLETLRKKEEEKIKKEMSKIGIDWSEGQKKGSPSGTVTLEILDEKGNVRKGLSPGESGFLHVSVENRGSGTFYQLAGVTKSDDPIFANLEFPFGKVAPREKKEWKTPLKIPDFFHRRSIPVEIDFHEEFSRTPKSDSFPMQIEETATLLFSYRYSLLDDGSRGSKGNGNRQAERGETVDLLITVKNVGKGESRSPVINLKNLEGEGAFIEKGREELKPIPPGGESEGLLRIRIPANGQNNKLSFDLTVLDGHLGDELTDRLVLSLEGQEATPPPEALQSPPIIEIHPDQPSLVSHGASYVIKGRAFDDHEVKNVSLFVGNDKVLYRFPVSPEKSLKFETTVSLKKGANLITVASQDDRELTTRRQWIVWRNK